MQMVSPRQSLLKKWRPPGWRSELNTGSGRAPGLPRRATTSPRFSATFAPRMLHYFKFRLTCSPRTGKEVYVKRGAEGLAGGMSANPAANGWV